VQFLVCAENAKQHKDEPARAIRQHIRGNPLQSGKDKDMDSPTESVEIAGENKEDSFPEKSADCLLHAMKTVLDWRASCKDIFHLVTHFQSSTVQLKLSQFYYSGATLKSTASAFDVTDKVLSFLREWQGTADNLNIADARDAKNVIYRTLNAKVHAEAALMDWIVTVKVGLPTFHAKFSYSQNHIPTLGCSSK